MLIDYNKPTDEVRVRGRNGILIPPSTKQNFDIASAMGEANRKFCPVCGRIFVVYNTSTRVLVPLEINLSQDYVNTIGDVSPSIKGIFCENCNTHTLRLRFPTELNRKIQYYSNIEWRGVA